MEQRSAETFNVEDDGTLKEIGRYSAASLEYSTLVLGSLLQRGCNSLKKGAETVAAPFQISGKIIKQSAQQVVAPIKRLGTPAQKILFPFSWVGGKLANTGSRGIPVHLDRETLGSITKGLTRIEERLARLEEKGIVFAQGMTMPHHPTPDDFKEKPSKEKNILLRAILEDSKVTMEND